MQRNIIRVDYEKYNGVFLQRIADKWDGERA